MKDKILLMVAVPLLWLAGCGGGDRPADLGSAAEGTVSRAPIVGDATGKARVFIGFKRQPGPAEEALVREHGGQVKYIYHLVPAIAATIPQAAVAALERNPNVAYVEGDGECYALGQTLPWGVDRIDAERVHSVGNKGSGIKVAVIDTGIDYNHPDLNDNYAGGYDFVNKDSDPKDDNGHGTHCAGTIAAEDNGEGVIGVAPEASLYALKVLNASGSGYWSDVAAAIDWTVSNGLQIASMSLGGGYSSTLEAACNGAYNANVLLVAAAGNSGNARGTGDNVQYPARFDSVIAVAATDTKDRRARFSSTGPAVELAAPGVKIYSTLLNGKYGTASGTSMACPHVSGTAALVMAAYPTWTADQVRTRLDSTAKDLGASGRDPWYGYGLVDAWAAVGLSP